MTIPRITSPKVAAVTQQVEPTSTMRMEVPSTSRSPPVEPSEPSAVNPGASEPGRASIENDIRDAVGSGIIDGEANSTGEREFGTTS